ncbi:HEPN domain-containing protein [Acidobacteria bacterium AH-259-G07]|nr:HEPN domain-containing protein [Acidobacteria bacterium AH-259-G07]
MTNQQMARGHLSRAYRILAEAEGHYEQQAWNLVVRRCQEAVELALKGALRLVGLEVPRIHDVGVFLKKHNKRFRGKIAEEIDRVASI